MHSGHLMFLIADTHWLKITKCRFTRNWNYQLSSCVHTTVISRPRTWTANRNVCCKLKGMHWAHHRILPFLCITRRDYLISRLVVASFVRVSAQRTHICIWSHQNIFFDGQTCLYNLNNSRIVRYTHIYTHYPISRCCAQIRPHIGVGWPHIVKYVCKMKKRRLFRVVFHAARIVWFGCGLFFGKDELEVWLAQPKINRRPQI